jgi:hypothetical protein
LKTIGKGNFAKVKLARHILTGREVNICVYFCCSACHVDFGEKRKRMYVFGVISKLTEFFKIA